MEQTDEPQLQALLETWSPRVIAALEKLGQQRWPPHMEKQGFLKRPKPIQRFAIEGPLMQENEILWAVSHTISPSAFDIRGNLTQGEREYWLIALTEGDPSRFRVEGAQIQNDIPVQEDAFQAALVEALAAGPVRDTFYGNRGPLSHRSPQRPRKK